MIELELSAEAFEEVRDKCIAAGLIADEPREWDEDSKPFTVGGVTFKEWKYVPTPEEIARREEFYKAPFGQIMLAQAKRIAEDFIKEATRIDTLFVEKHGDVGSVLHIRLPNDFTVTK